MLHLLLKVSGIVVPKVSGIVPKVSGIVVPKVSGIVPKVSGIVVYQCAISTFLVEGWVGEWVLRNTNILRIF